MMAEQPGEENSSRLVALVVELGRQAERCCVAELRNAELSGQRRAESAAVAQERREAHDLRRLRIARRHADLRRNVELSEAKCAEMRAKTKGQGPSRLEEQMHELAERISAEKARMEARNEELELRVALAERERRPCAEVDCVE